MLITISAPTPDLSFLLCKNPNSGPQEFNLPSGKATVFFPDYNDYTCTMAMILDIDPIDRVKEHKGGNPLFVDDRPFTASSFMSVALGRVFNTAMRGDSVERPELAKTPLNLIAGIHVVRSHKGKEFIHRLFEPLGYEVTTSAGPLDPAFPEWGESPYFSVELLGYVRLNELLRHLAVLLPVLDGFKHYKSDDTEVEKLLKRGEGWIDQHPMREMITARFLGHDKGLTKSALEQMEPQEAEDEDGEEVKVTERSLERPLGLQARRIAKAKELLLAYGAKSICDLGCSDGDLIVALREEESAEKLIGVDVSPFSLNKAKRNLKIRYRQDPKIQMVQSSLTYRDDRLVGFDAYAMLEVIEHIDKERLPAVEEVVFGFIKPKHLVLSTPNRDYNFHWNIPDGEFRNRDHRFEWSEVEFTTWLEYIAGKFHYMYEIHRIGDGATLMAAMEKY